jgi:23S rRNA pseudouridine1911/1915/1917 synthase
VDGGRVSRFSLVLSPGQKLRVLSALPGPAEVFPPGLGPSPLDILHADPWLVAIDKPSGLLSVATEREKTLTAVRLMRDWLSGLKNPEERELHAAHRLDRDASGVLLLARSLETRSRLVAGWRGFAKTYLAVVDGLPPRPEGKLETPLREDRGLFVRAAATGGGREAITYYRLLRRRGGRSLLEVRLDTGRKHQIRVHLAHLGCPVAGDRRYGGSQAPRLALHAGELALTHPEDGRQLRIRSETPPELLKILES